MHKHLTVLSLFVVLLCVTMIAISLNCLSAAALSSTDSPSQANSLGICGNQNNSYSTILAQAVPSGAVYARLAGGESPSNVTLYNQDFHGYACQQIGSATVSQNGWTWIGTFTSSSNKPDVIVTNGSGLQLPGPYESAISLLILPNNTICNIAANCQVLYDGFMATLQPMILSKADDQVAIYEASPISGVGYSKVSYYADNQFLYSRTLLKPINRNYLEGGTHNIVIQVQLKNGEQLSIKQTINMGPDFTGELAIKSRIYRTLNEGLFFIVAACAVLVLCISLFVIRYLYKRHREFARHFPRDYTARNPSNDHDDNIFVG